MKPTVSQKIVAVVTMLASEMFLSWLGFSLTQAWAWRSSYLYEKIFNNPEAIDIMGICSIYSLITILAVCSAIGTFNYVTKGRFQPC